MSREESEEKPSIYPLRKPLRNLKNLKEKELESKEGKC